MPDPTVSVLFVCLGNICRSPMAKAVFLHAAKERNALGRFRADSCGTGGWHAGGPADPRTLDALRRRGVPVEHVARVVRPEADFHAFDHLVAMDRANVARLLKIGAPPAKVCLLRSFDPELADAPDHAREVPDPYESGPEAFDEVFAMIDRACRGMIDRLLAAR
ncbi:MAG: low molecular weight phosphotyrosine protein phosphatase [Phycisphaerales bacterium]|nr:low molecular weight phosphotyrosine protein phosphatase [Phycisphaerales bacterium]